MKKKQQKNKKLFWLIVGVFIGLLLVALIMRFIKMEVILPAKTYHSKVLKVSMDIPNDYSIEEGSVTVTFKNNKGEITLLRIGTNMDTLEDYLQDITDYNHLKLTNKENLIVNDLAAIKVDINGKRNYLFYKDNLVYSLETKSPELYTDLDRIAKSFRYEP